MEDLTLALITLTSFVLLFVVAIFADRAGVEAEEGTKGEPVLVPVESGRGSGTSAVRSRAVDADVA